jgi:hypothetical protein
LPNRLWPHDASASEAAYDIELLVDSKRREEAVLLHDEVTDDQLVLGREHRLVEIEARRLLFAPVERRSERRDLDLDVYVFADCR